MTPTTIAPSSNPVPPVKGLTVLFDEKPFIPLMGFQTTLEYLPGRSAEYRARQSGNLNTHTCTCNYRLRMPDGNNLLVGVLGAQPTKLANLIVALETEAPILSILGVARLEDCTLAHRNDLRSLPECMDEAYRMIATDLSLPRA